MNNKHQNKKKSQYSLSLLTLALFSPSLYAQNELDFSFLQGANTQVPEVLKQSSGNVLGQYLVDVFLNGKKIGRQTLTISQNEKQSLCLSPAWLMQLDLPINYKKMSSAFNSTLQCYNFEQIQGGKANFDYSQQSLKLSLPQIVLLHNNQSEHWDYGTPGFRLNYNVNGNKSIGHGLTKNTQGLYGNFDLNANHGQWVFSAKVSGTNTTGFMSSGLTLSTAIQSVRGDLIIGKSFTQSSILPDFSFYGASLRSNSAMKSWSARGYAPVIDGVLNSNSLITVKQGDYVLYSKTLPAGPYSLTDISPISNGDITVTVTGGNGTIISTRKYPVTTLPTLLRMGDFNYNFATGIRENSSQIDGIFGLASLDYGLDFGTINFASIIHPQYQSIGSGVTVPLGEYGAISTSLNTAWSHYDSAAFQPSGERTQRGLSATLQYAKDFGQDTNLQLLTYRYSGEGYNDFSSFYPRGIHVESDKRSRYEAIITQRIGPAYLNASGWAQDYRNGRRRDSGANLTLSGTIGKGIYLGLNGSYTHSGTSGSQYSTSLSVSIPFDLWEQNQYSNSSISYDSISGTSFNTGMSFSTSDRVTNNVNVSLGEHQRTASLYTGVRFDTAQTGFSVSQSEQSTALSANISGSIAGAQGVGLAYSNQQNDTIAIAHIKGLKDIKFNSSSPTNQWGNTIIPLSSYQPNTITVDTNNIPENVELLNSTYRVVPTNQAIIVRDYKYKTVNRYLLRILNKQGQPLPMGTAVQTNKGIDVGFIANGGVLFATLLSPSKYLKLQDNNIKCKIDITNIKPGSSQVTDVHCQ
ncbi:PefC/AfrB family outer membrane usher protein [Photobacterium damselae]|uniref:Usher protein n=2 Tax=Photobacterium damselae TaxID=38293 RepID=D0Z5B4_PHODD|nr:PefC/AfrB family outer membrane usher protein [Photobacterium damselae]EEZ39036.1 usher protein [Photobacterium damselae subsp. damselae CIP 102761]